MKRVTYSPSLTIPLTRACTNRCLYCGYRREGEGLLSEIAIRDALSRGHREGVSEILILSGEGAERIPEVRRDLEEKGMTSFVPWVIKICEIVLDAGLLPHVNIGPVDAASLDRLKEVSASMGLMIEGINPDVNTRIHPGKDISERLRMIESAGKLKIPFTSGILMGLGEKQKDRLDSILALARIHSKYGHLQEVILQRYVPNPQSRVRAEQISFEELEEIILFCRAHLPEVSIQVPPNIERYWKELIHLGANDLGGMGSGGDLINPGHPWPQIEQVSEELARKGYGLKKRFPIYERFYRKGWYSRPVGVVLEDWIGKDDEYKYYAEEGLSGDKTLC